MKRLTDKQQRILSFIRVFTAKTGESPTVREIGDSFGIKSPNGVVGHIKAIEAKGRLKRLGFMPRGLTVIDDLCIQFGGTIG